MSRARRIALLSGLFAATLIGAVFVTDAVDGGSEDGGALITVADADSPADAEPIPVAVPVWVETGPTPGDGPPGGGAPEGGEPAPESGLQVVQPPPDPEQDVTPAAPDPGPVDVGDVDAIAEEAAEAGQPADGTIGGEGSDLVTALLELVPLDPGRLSFVDPCAALPDGVCPFGIPAVVVLQGEEPFRLLASPFRGEEGRFRSDGRDLCPSDFTAGDDNILFLTTAPAAIEFAYGASRSTEPFRAEALPAPGPGDAEYDRWAGNVEAGDLDTGDPSTWVRSCATLDLEPGTVYIVVPVTARSTDGRVAELDWVPSVDTRPPPGSAGRPPTSLVTRGGNDLTVYVWSRDPEEGHRTVAWPIDQSEPGAPTCSEIEAELFVARYWGREHPDLRLAVFGVVPIVEDRPPSVYDPQWGWRQQFDLRLREGRRYTLCTWEARLGEASFDSWEILEREQFEIVPPNRHPVVMTLTRVGVSGGSIEPRVRLYVDPHAFCDWRGPVGATVERARPGTQLVREVLCETRGIGPDPTAFVEVAVDGVEAGVVAIPLDPARGCERDGPDPSCSTPISEHFDAAVEVPGSCATACASVNLGIRVDYLASMGMGSDRWQVGAPGSFAGSAGPGDGGPAVDLYSLTLDPVPGRVDALTAGFELNRAADFTIHAVAAAGEESCNGAASGSGEGSVEVVIEGLCPDTHYGLARIELSEPGGAVVEQDLAGWAPPVWTNGYASYLTAHLRLRSVLDEAAAADHCRNLDRSFVTDVGDRCWEQVGVSPASRVYLGRVLAGAQDGDVCPGRPASPFSFHAPPLENRHVQAAVHGESIPIDLYVLPMLDARCGSTGRSPTPYSVFDIEFELSLAQLDESWRVLVEDHGLIWEFELLRLDAGIRNRLG